MAIAVGNVGSGQTVFNTVSSPELALLQKQLSDSVNSDSAKTSQGQALIERLGLRIAALQGQQQDERGGPLLPSLPPRPAEGPLGTRLDVYA